MTEAILDSLGSVLTRWTMGGSAIAAAPAVWRDRLGDGDEAELRLLALSGQFLGALVLAEPTGAVQVRADLPILAHPPLPDALRPRARRLLQQLRDTTARRTLLDFLDARGWTLHPGDWLPGVNEDVPETYAPWQDWAAASESASSAQDVLTAESWGMLGPAALQAAFAALRRQDRARASALLAEKIADESADVRVRLLERLGIGLSDVDRPLLEALATDRAPRVKALAGSLLARLGYGEQAGEDAAELADFFTVEIRGLLRRTRQIAAKPLKTPAQRTRRAALMEALSFDMFAGALAMPPAELVAAWLWASDGNANHLLAAMAARSASDPIVAAIAEALTTAATIDLHGLSLVLPRLGPAQRRQAAAHILRVRGSSFTMALTIAGGGGHIDDAMRTAAGTDLIAALKAAEAKPGDQSAELMALGLLASRPAARQALEHLAAAGLIASDPRLDMLRLNAALDDKGAH